MNAMNDAEERAALYLSRREDPEWSSQDEAELTEWLEESFAHKAAYWRLEEGWTRANMLASLGASVTRPRWHMHLPDWHHFAAAAALLLAVLLGARYLGVGATPDPVVARYVTIIGHRAMVPLSDGTKVELNTATAMRALVTPERREIWLDRGEAYFNVAHDAAHPLIIHSGTQVVTVLGTKFVVRHDGGRVTVSVLEGRVRVQPADERRRGAENVMTPGDMALVDGQETLIVHKSLEELDDVLSWRSGILSFNQATLGEVAAEFNRYNRRQIILGNAEAAAMRIGGRFRATDVDAFLRLLQLTYDVQLVRKGEIVELFA